MTARVRAKVHALTAGDDSRPFARQNRLATEQPAAEGAMLAHYLTDLLSVLASPVTGPGHETGRVARTLLDALVRTVRLDFAYLRSTESGEGSPQTWLRSAADLNESHPTPEVDRALAGYVNNHVPGACVRIDHPLGPGTVSMVGFDLGLPGAAVGTCLAASRRIDFPTESERVLLQVAINQAAVSLQEARHMSERRQLTAVNETLRKEIAERTRSEQALAETEDRLKRMADSVPEVIWISDLEPTERVVYTSPSFERVWGLPVEDLYHNPRLWIETIHPDDRARVTSLFAQWIGGADVSYQDVEYRIVQPGGAIRWIHDRGVLTVNAQGRPIRVSGIAADITDRKRAEDELKQAFVEIQTLKELLQHENIALRQEIEQTSMFEEIVGTSAPLRTALSHVAKVAPTDSTVLITGETGTGKELVARAIHKRSPRASRAFVAVNCAAIPASLIASELFGHEKGAFTGAVQRRQGRFELADGGTIFLDEVGELPAETQMTLLRVLQEREFERVGGSAPIRVNVRVIAASNRDLEVAIAEGTFRADLFYRLNVFPLDMPALRERRTDIPLLVEYFVHRYATRAGKRIRGISKETSNLLQSYDWPGNIRELQNVIERAVIVADLDCLSIDERWLSGRRLKPLRVANLPTSTLATQEKDAIEAALRESKGRVAGPFGAAARLAVASSTLESKIKALKIDKRSFKLHSTPYSPADASLSTNVAS